MLNQSDLSNKTNNINSSSSSLSQMLQNIFSDNSNIMLAAIISLLLVILFVLLLHLYAKWFLFQAQAQARERRRRRRRRITTVTVSDVLGPARFHHFHSFNLQDSPLSSTSHTKGLDSSIIASIPIFIYEASAAEQAHEHEQGENDDNKVNKQELECVICLSSFEDGEMGKCLPKCGHGFHVECIDMWLTSHSNCPICRAPIVVGIVLENDSHVGSVREVDDDNSNDNASALVEIVAVQVDDAHATPSSETSRESGNDNNNNNNNAGVNSGSVSVTDDDSSLLFGCSLKRMLSKVFPSSNLNELPS